MKYLLATCGADQHFSKENTDLGNFLKRAFYSQWAWSNSAMPIYGMNRFYDAFYRKLQLHKDRKSVV